MTLTLGITRVYPHGNDVATDFKHIENGCITNTRPCGPQNLRFFSSFGEDDLYYSLRVLEISTLSIHLKAVPIFLGREEIRKKLEKSIKGPAFPNFDLLIARRATVTAAALVS